DAPREIYVDHLRAVGVACRGLLHGRLAEDLLRSAARRVPVAGESIAGGARCGHGAGGADRGDTDADLQQSPGCGHLRIVPGVGDDDPAGLAAALVPDSDGYRRGEGDGVAIRGVAVAAGGSMRQLRALYEI